MTTDTKSVARWDLDYTDLYHTRISPLHNGDYVLFTDLERVVGELEGDLLVARGAFRSHEELCAIKERQINEILTALAASRAEVEGLKKDAERWRHARQLLTVYDIFNRQRELEGWNNLVSEEECERADKAIDAAMEKGNV